MNLEVSVGGNAGQLRRRPRRNTSGRFSTLFGVDET
jgi:hypothetical protein